MNDSTIERFQSSLNAKERRINFATASPSNSRDDSGKLIQIMEIHVAATLQLD